MSIEQMAKDFTQAVAEDRAEDYQAYWADDIVSLEPNDGPMSRCEGREACKRNTLGGTTMPRCTLPLPTDPMFSATSSQSTTKWTSPWMASETR